MGIRSLLTPNVRATFAVLFHAFIGAFLGYLQTQIEHGIPPENAWAHIVGAGVVVGVASAYNRWKPSPAAVGGAVALLVAFASIVAVVGLVACGASTPTVAQQAVVGTYSAELEGCFTRAKLLDAGGLASYEACAHGVDVTFGRAPADGGKL